MSCSAVCDPGKGNWIILGLAPTFLHMRFKPVGPTAVRIAQACPILHFHLVENQTERIGTPPTASGPSCSEIISHASRWSQKCPNRRLAVTALTMRVTNQLGNDNTLATQATGGQCQPPQQPEQQVGILHRRLLRRRQQPVPRKGWADALGKLRRLHKPWLRMWRSCASRWTAKEPLQSSGSCCCLHEQHLLEYGMSVLTWFQHSLCGLTSPRQSIAAKKSLQS